MPHTIRSRTGVTAPINIGERDELSPQELDVDFFNALDESFKRSEKKQFEQAIRDLNLATQFEPSSGRYHFHLALAYQGRDDRSAPKEALELAQAIGLSQKVMGPSEKSKYKMLQNWIEN